MRAVVGPDAAREGGPYRMYRVVAERLLGLPTALRRPPLADVWMVSVNGSR